jgi:hypothetical protein
MPPGRADGESLADYRARKEKIDLALDEYVANCNDAGENVEESVAEVAKRCGVNIETLKR